VPLNLAMIQQLAQGHRASVCLKGVDPGSEGCSFISPMKSLCICYCATMCIVNIAFNQFKNNESFGSTQLHQINLKFEMIQPNIVLFPSL